MESIKLTLNDTLVLLRKTKLEEAVDQTGNLERQVFFDLLSEWKAAYKAVTTDVRFAKSLRKTGNEQGSKYHWMDVRYSKRIEARRLMQARSFIKELSRRHWNSTNAAEVA